MEVICRPKHRGVHELCAKVGSCFREDSGIPSVMVAQDAANKGSNRLEARSLPPTLHNLQADLAAQQTGIGRVVPQGARRQVKLVDQGRALVESVVDP